MAKILKRRQPKTGDYIFVRAQLPTALKRKLDARSRTEHLSISALIARLLDGALASPVGYDLPPGEVKIRNLAEALLGVTERGEK